MWGLREPLDVQLGGTILFIEDIFLLDINDVLSLNIGLFPFLLFLNSILLLYYPYKYVMRSLIKDNKRINKNLPSLLLFGGIFPSLEFRKYLFPYFFLFIPYQFGAFIVLPWLTTPVHKHKPRLLHALRKLLLASPNIRPHLQTTRAPSIPNSMSSHPWPPSRPLALFMTQITTTTHILLRYSNLTWSWRYPVTMVPMVLAGSSRPLNFLTSMAPPMQTDCRWHHSIWMALLFVSFNGCSRKVRSLLGLSSFMLWRCVSPPPFMMTLREPTSN